MISLLKVKENIFPEPSMTNNGRNVIYMNMNIEFFSPLKKIVRKDRTMKRVRTLGC